MGGAYSTHGKDEKFRTKFWTENLEWKRPLRRPRRRWGDNIRVYLKQIRWKDVDWIHLTQDKDQWQALVSMVMNLWVPIS
jgi:hypothetical protein